jgi:hypothetical protein
MQYDQVEKRKNSFYLFVLKTINKEVCYRKILNYYSYQH